MKLITSGGSGVVTKFLHVHDETLAIDRHQKSTLLTRRHIIKGSSSKLPFVALNEYLRMQVTDCVMPAAKVEVSHDGRALVVNRFNVDENDLPHLGMEDFCALLAYVHQRSTRPLGSAS